MKKRILALLLALAMVSALAACSAKDPDPSASPSASADPSASQSPVPSETIVADLTQDVLTFAAGDLAKESDLITVNGKAVPTGLALYWLAFSCSYFENSYSLYGLTVADYADAIFNDNSTMAAYYTLLSQKTAENGCPLTDEQQQAITDKLSADGNTLEQRKALYGLDEDNIRFLYSVSDLYDNLLDALVPVPTEEELNNYVYQARHILLLTVDMEGTPTVNEAGAYVYPSLDEETIAEKRALAEEILGKLQKLVHRRDMHGGFLLRQRLCVIGKNRQRKADRECQGGKARRQAAHQIVFHCSPPPSVVSLVSVDSASVTLPSVTS